MVKTPKITKEMTVDEILKKYPKTAVIFMNYGLHCAGCPLAQSETIEQLVKANMLDEKKLLEELNKLAE